MNHIYKLVRANVDGVKNIGFPVTRVNGRSWLGRFCHGSTMERLRSPLLLRVWWPAAASILRILTPLFISEWFASVAQHWTTFLHGFRSRKKVPTLFLHHLRGEQYLSPAWKCGSRVREIFYRLPGDIHNVFRPTGRWQTLACHRFLHSSNVENNMRLHSQPCSLGGSAVLFRKRALGAIVCRYNCSWWIIDFSQEQRQTIHVCCWNVSKSTKTKIYYIFPV